VAERVLAAVFIVCDLELRLALALCQRDLEASDVVELVQLQVSPQPDKLAFARLEGPDLARGPYSLRGEQGEQTLVGTGVKEGHPGGEDLIKKSKLIWFEAAADVKLLADVVAQVEMQA